MSTLCSELKSRVKYKPPWRDPTPYSASLFQRGAGGGETVEFAIPFLYLLYLAQGWLLLAMVPVPPPCAGGLPVWGFPLGSVGPTH